MRYVQGLPDYYQILQVSRDANFTEIKKAFRRRAKEIHPDTGEGFPQTLSAMRELLSAYETLINGDLREEYDIQYRQMFPRGGFNYREFLLRSRGDMDSAGKLIFFDLLHAHQREALDLYDTLVEHRAFDLSQHLDREDFMDCSFLLAEEYEQKQNFVEAFNLFKTLIEFELETPYFKHFFQELLDRMRRLLLQEMENNVTIDRHIDFVLQVAYLPLSEKERAPYMKKLAELYLLKSDTKRAQFFLREAKKMNPGIAGIKAFEKKLETNPFKV